ncbi:hypothetical protein ZIOFF_062177 [Zingiber officinale]|uniref:Uncharacterized protein n=1 Tax=Zingiber officinale TaxID=94328 RepID=A0A8J5F543_ZINOF|nr:hypothetical protein ZIOFF_062177 [Zingiber officinale]
MEAYPSDTLRDELSLKTEPVRQDVPLLGDESASMPPGAFGALIEMPVQQKQPICSYDGNFERFDTKSLKVISIEAGFLSTMEHSLASQQTFCLEHSLASSSNVNGKLETSISHMVHPQKGHRAIHEYQFLLRQPRVQSRTYDRISQSLYHNSSIDVSSIIE